MSKQGIVYLVGAGPGEKELITVKGLRLLRACQVVIYDRLASPLLLDEVPKACEKIDVGKRVGSHSYTQEMINQLLVQKALEGKRIVRLKGGDPFVFGRGGEEIQALADANIPYEVIPGVTSAISVPLYAGVPVTHRGISQSFHVVTGYTSNNESGRIENLKALAGLKGTLVFLMGMTHLKEIVEGLMRYGKAGDTPACIISKGATTFQREVRGMLKNIVELSAQQQIEAPAVIVIGEVAGMRLVYEKESGLFKKYIALMMTEQLADKLAPPLLEQGANVIKLGGIRIEKNKLTEEEKNALRQIESYSWLVFTSSYGVKFFFEQLNTLGIDHRKLNHLRFAVIGSGTGEALKNQGFLADYTPEVYTSSALTNGLSKRIKKEEHVLIPRAMQGNRGLSEQLRQTVNVVTDLKLYDMVVDQKKLMSQLSQLSKLDMIVFGSSAGARGFIRAANNKGRQLLSQCQIVCMGELTAKTLEQLGFKTLHVAKSYSAEGVMACIMEMM